ncbi:hypothetical protein HanPSC8_Chr03g0088131 [Helianthus annuus]|nr:hypothetical protein HanPSC8_Chr03g0088131 [Helianthus annuus]
MLVVLTEFNYRLVSYRENVMEHDRSLRGLITMSCEYEITGI